ncbi:polysaccharide biosynthesis/export family protein [Cyanobacterium aponinum AL20118]|uniref:SLBB domain-containing protein n=1 Tax=Cyanobacterium aponinum AL20115 TaxID=3090662 RepID=A0AAF0Z8L3_9CHRO|nr:polysaccharide biosynthesis/export family protein [Cyanobacterium aponinum]PHV63705.1 sugar transporter [Cyanobacterium aponinum IPPAS B-1201]WPF87408.1 SLBB domain-containing protein [Cyanobacterium aponinum AL20115]
MQKIYYSTTALVLLMFNLLSCNVFAQELAQRQPLKPLTGNNNPNTVNSDYPISASQDSLAQRFPYTLDAGDVVSLNIFNVPEYSREYQVLVDGTLNLPLINRVTVAGLTLAEAELLISQEYVSQGLLRDPIVSIDLTIPRPITIAMVGEIRTPGSYSIPFETGGSGGGGSSQASGKKFPTLISALQLGNGINASADIRNLRVERNFKGRDYIIPVNLWDFLQNGDLQQNIVLRDGDRIIIPSAQNIDPAEVLRTATANFSANLSLPISISIVGEVNRPGPYTLTGDDVKANNLTDELSFDSNRVINSEQSLAGIPTATRAIKTAGGLTAKADIRNIEVRRTLPSGEDQTIKVNLWEILQTGKFTEDAILQNGDRVFIPTAESIDDSEVRQVAVASFSPNTINVSVIGEVKDPGLKQLPPNVSLQQALLQAGGFNNRRANEATAKLIRLNPNGTVTEKIVKVDFSAPLNKENNPPLLNNDIVFIDRSGFAVVSDATYQIFDPFAQIIGIIANTARIFDIFDND